MYVFLSWMMRKDFTETTNVESALFANFVSFPCPCCYLFWLYLLTRIFVFFGWFSRNDFYNSVDNFLSSVSLMLIPWVLSDSFTNQLFCCTFFCLSLIKFMMKQTLVHSTPRDSTLCVRCWHSWRPSGYYFFSSFWEADETIFPLWFECTNYTLWKSPLTFPDSLHHFCVLVSIILHVNSHNFCFSQTMDPCLLQLAKQPNTVLAYIVEIFQYFFSVSQIQIAGYTTLQGTC